MYFQPVDLHLQMKNVPSHLGSTLNLERHPAHPSRAHTNRSYPVLIYRDLPSADFVPVFSSPEFSMA